MSHIHNFNAGPAVLPAEVIQQIQAELPNYQQSGISILESSHRSKEYEALNQRAMERVKRLLGLGDSHQIGFLQGGASHQFAMLPMNILQPGRSGAYVLTGVWAEKAYEEAGRIGSAHIAASSKADNYAALPAPATWQVATDAAYVHITSNNTIYGTQWATLPPSSQPLVVDMSSDIGSRPIDASNIALIYAGAQKNLGPAGVTVVAIHNDFLAQMHTNVPTILRYQTHLAAQSLYNTPPVFSVYVLDLVLAWIEALGLDNLAARNAHKAQLVYDVIDQSGGFYRGHSAVNARSQMNVVFRLPDADLEKKFLATASSHGMIGLAGHRIIGGLRASLYNALPVASAQALAQLMQEFQRTHG